MSRKDFMAGYRAGKRDAVAACPRKRTSAKDLSYVLNQFEYEPEVCFYEEIDSYYKMIKTREQAVAYNYSSDYWGDADDYQADNVMLMTDLEPYIGKQVTFRDFEFDEPVTLVGIAIDRQYSSVSHTCVVVE